jgi:MOSC domain-containing protein YiiM
LPRRHPGHHLLDELTGLRNPCKQLESIQPGLMAAVPDRDAQGNLIRKAGVLGVVLAGGEVRPADPIRVELPSEPYQPLGPV